MTTYNILNVRVVSGKIRKGQGAMLKYNVCPTWISEWHKHSWGNH